MWLKLSPLQWVRSQDLRQALWEGRSSDGQRRCRQQCRWHRHGRWTEGSPAVAVATGPGVTTTPGADTPSDSEELSDSGNDPILDRGDLMNRCNECGVRCIKPLSTADFPAVATAFYLSRICFSRAKYSKGNGKRGMGRCRISSPIGGMRLDPR